MRIAALVLFVAIASTSHAQELTEAEIKARDFSYKTAVFGMSLADFKNDFSVGMPSAVNDMENTITYRVGVSRGREMRMEFTNNRLSKL